MGTFALATMRSLCCNICMRSVAPKTTVSGGIPAVTRPCPLLARTVELKDEAPCSRKLKILTCVFTGVHIRNQPLIEPALPVENFVGLEESLELSIYYGQDASTCRKFSGSLILARRFGENDSMKTFAVRGMSFSI